MPVGEDTDTLAMSGGALPQLVGRGRELDQLGRAMGDAQAGRGRFVILMGEPGIGKTRLCDELTMTAVCDKVPVLWGRAWEAGGAPAYWPWMEVLAGLSRPMDEATLSAALGDGMALVADLVPQIRLRLAATPVPAPPSPDEARFRLWRSVVSLVRRAAEPAALVLVFDDLHSTDKSSLLLLYALARELRTMRVLLVATCRDVEARLDADTGELISRLAREAVTVGLSRLDRSAVEALVRRRAGELAPAVQSRLFDSTQGNPLFVQEMLRLLEEEGSSAITAGVVPSGVRDVIRQRLDRVDGEARDLLDIAAVAGDEVLPALLAAACGRDSGWVSTRVVEATRAGVFRDRAGRPHFSHALVREVLYRDLPEARRRTLHAAVGLALLSAPGAERDPPLMELAHHAIESGPDHLPQAVTFAARAAARALSLAAPEEALSILLRVAAAVENAGNAPALRAPVLLALAETRIWRGEVVVGKSLCCQVATLARSLGDAALLAGAALTYGRVFTFAVVDPVMVQLLEDALQAQPPGDSTTRARLLARLAGALQPASNADEPVALAREAIATARRLGDRRGLLQTIHDGLSALMDVVDPRERLSLNLEVEELALAEGDRERLMRTHARLALDYLALGQFKEADARIEAFDQLAAALRASWISWRVPLFRAVRATLEGRFAEAERLEEEAAALARQAEDPQAERALVFHREGLLRTAERHAEMRALDPRARRERINFQNAPGFQAISSAMLFTRLEDAEGARAHLDSLPEELLPPVSNLFALFSIAEAAAFVGTAALADKTYQLLVPAADQCVMLGMTQIQWEGPVVRLMALLAARLGRWDQATEHFQDALERLRQLGARPHLARTQYEFARALLQRGRLADQDRAGALLAAARELAEELGMSGLVQVADAAIAGAALPVPARRQGNPAPSAGAATAGLSPSASSAPALTMVLEGEYWTVSAPGGQPFRLKDSLGLQYLARLVAEPGREIHVLDLAGGGLGSPDGAAVDTGDSGALLDDEARALYRRRLDDLRETVAEAESFGDATRAAGARAEIDFLAAELARAVGLGGRARRSGSAAERARSAVQRRIKNALARIAEAQPDLAPALARAVKTGNFCVYRPGE